MTKVISGNFKPCTANFVYKLGRGTVDKFIPADCWKDPQQAKKILNWSCWFNSASSVKYFHASAYIHTLFSA